MLEVEIVCIGKLKQAFLRDGCAEYLKMLGGYARVTVTELPEARISKAGAAEIEKVVGQESKAILKYIENKRAAVVAMCIEGRKYSSEDVARFLAETPQTNSSIIFIIGGSHGLTKELTAKADVRMSMSDMTFPHQLARMMLLEQLYRAFSINANGKYHK